MKNEKLTKTAKILIVESIFVIGILIYLSFLTAPAQIYPLSGMTIITPDFVFEIQNGEEILVSIDEMFTNPIILKKESDIILPPGLYYWKVRNGFRESGVQNFTIQSHVGLNIEEREENYELQNSGNVELNVTKEKSGIVSEIVLDIGEFTEVEKDDSIYEGVQK
ncbi:MAG: hypothetical protein KKF68_01615 [Nanoarchaeota archaeon]|nr:hypothetical protein [Nanoarchaeota archaeon]